MSKSFLSQLRESYFLLTYYLICFFIQRILPQRPFLLFCYFELDSWNWNLSLDKSLNYVFVSNFAHRENNSYGTRKISSQRLRFSIMPTKSFIYDKNIFCAVAESVHDWRRRRIKIKEPLNASTHRISWFFNDCINLRPLCGWIKLQCIMNTWPILVSNTSVSVQCVHLFSRNSSNWDFCLPLKFFALLHFVVSKLKVDNSQSSSDGGTVCRFLFGSLNASLDKGIAIFDLRRAQDRIILSKTGQSATLPSIWPYQTYNFS